MRNGMENGKQGENEIQCIDGKPTLPLPFSVSYIPSFFHACIPIATLLPWIHLTLPFHTMMNTILPVKLPTTIQ